MDKQRISPVLRGALFFGVIGPLVGGALMHIFLDVHDHWVGGNGTLTQVLFSIVFLILPSYLFGLLPALFTGMLACAFLDRVRSLAAFLGVCLLAEILVSGVFGFAVGRWAITTDQDGVSPPNMFFNDGKIALFFALLGAIPAVVAGTLWWRRQRRAGKAGNTQVSTA